MSYGVREKKKPPVWEGRARRELHAESETVIFAIYVDSWLFVFATAILQFGIGVDSALSVCGAAILLCLVFYVTTKVGY